ncbi:MAG: hypothetical protein JNL36_03745 [Candidatus Kapabacteria bacterium]|nr:hypothetical protein [Candidatus Kapabacteria bacterium]
MIKYLLICFAVPLVAFAEKPAEMLFAPHEYDYTKNIVSVEAGSALFFSGFGLTYERSFSKSFSLRGSAGYIVKSDFLDGTENIHSTYPSGAVQGVYVFGNEGWGFEISGGVQYVNVIPLNGQKNVFLPTAGLGIRYKPVTEGIFFRAGIGTSVSIMGLGVGIGYTWRD